MTRDDLRVALEGATGEAVPTCRAVLDEPTAQVDADAILERLASTTNLVTLYRGRASHVEDIGLPTLGFRDVVDRLEATPHEKLRLALITGPSGYPWCVLFLAPDETEVVAAVAVLAPLQPL